MKRVSIVFALLVAALPATAVTAAPPHGHKFEKQKEHREERGRHEDRRDDDRYDRHDRDRYDHDRDRDGDREALPRYYGYDGKSNPGRGWGVGSIPPGHMKKIYPGMHLRPEDYVILRDLDQWRLPRPDRDSMYVRRDDQIYRMSRDSQTVLEAIGIVSDLLR